MWLVSLLRGLGSGPRHARRDRGCRPQRHRRPAVTPRLVALEDRTVPSTFLVENLADSGPGSLRQAVLDANANPGPDLIGFAPAASDGTIALTGGELNITDDLIIDGPGVNLLTVSGNNSSRVFSISGSTTDVEIRDLTIADGRATGPTAVGLFGPVTLGGGLLNTGANVLLSHVSLENNQAVGPLAEGGAIASFSGGTLAVTHSTFTDNRAAGDIRAVGGALANDGGSTLALDYSTFTANQATAVLGFGLGGIQGGANGGALANWGGSQATVFHCTFEGNMARGGNGADGGPGQNGGTGGTGLASAIGNDAGSLLVPFASSTMTVAQSTFLGNRGIGGAGGTGGAGGAGGTGGVGGAGAITNGGSTLMVSHSTFLGNQAMGGNGGRGGAGGNGGVGGRASTGALGSTNPLPAFTGGELVRATLHVSHCLLQDNEAIGGAGGAGGAGGNGADGGLGRGGGLSIVFTDWDVSHSVIVLNRATGGAGGDRGSGGLLGGTGGAGQGGGLINQTGSVGALSCSTVVQNTAAGGGGGLGRNGGNGQGGGVVNGGLAAEGTPSLMLLRSLVALNRADGGAAGVGGSAGLGQGGGLYLTPGGMAYADLVTAILANHASTSDDDVFGDLGDC